MSRVHALPRRLDGEAATPEAIERALDQLPAEVMTTVRQHLARAVSEYEASGDAAPMLHFADSLLITARLQKNDHYQQARIEAEAEDSRGGQSVEKVTDFVERMRAKYGS